MFREINLFTKKQNVIGILLILMMFFLCGCKVEKNNMIKASAGKLNLSNWNFQKDGLVKLDGQWELYWGQLLEPKDFKNNDKKEKIDFFKIPNSFRNTENNRKLPKSGYGTMRLVINMKADKDKLYGIETQSILSASKIWINGQLVTSAGVVSKDASNTIGSFEHQLAFFKNEDSEAEIVIQMSNFNNVTGKIQGILLGNSMQIKRDYILNIAKDLFVIGCLFIMGIYHFALYYKVKKYKEPLYFGAFCLVIAIRNILVSKRFIFELYPNISFSIFNKAAYLTVYVALPLIVMFFKEIFVKEISSKAISITKVLSIIISLITICTNIEFYDKFLIYYEIWIIMICGYILFIVIKATINRNEGALIILFGLIVFLITVVHDMFLQAGMLNTNSLVPSGFFIFIFSQSYMLAVRFSNAFIKVEKLVEENKALYRDELTGIMNRRGFYDQGISLYKDALNTDTRFILFYGDLNNLKTINDSFGHKEGDEAIKTTAQILKASFDEQDIVARMSGDEFTIIAVNKASEGEAKRIIKLINSNFHKYDLTSNKPYKLSISVGYSIYLPTATATFEEMIHEADNMLYAEKDKWRKHM